MLEKFRPNVTAWLLLVLLTYFAFSVAGAAKPLFLKYSDWNIYWLTKICLFSLSVFFIFKFFPTDFKYIPPPKSSARLTCGDPLLLMRTMACIFVLFQHGFGIVFPPLGLKEHIWDEGLWLFLPSAWVGVWMFFFLSGYLMGKGFFAGRYPLDKTGILVFYRNRFLKIVPMYLVVLLLAAYLIEPTIFEPKNLWMLLSIMLFDYDGTFALNPVGSLWSIATEMHFYVIAPVAAMALLQFFKQRGIKSYGVMFAGLLVYGLCYRTINFIEGGLYWKSSVMTPFLGNLDLFLGGMTLALMLQKIKIKPLPILAGILTLLSVYVIGAYFVSAVLAGKDYLGYFGYLGPIISGVISFVLVMIFETGVMQNIKTDYFSAKLIAISQLFGILTYNIYLLHEPLQKLVAGALKGHTLLPYESIGVLFATTGLAFMIALGIHKTVDRYVEKFRY